jgi:hypothetical protein
MVVVSIVISTSRAAGCPDHDRTARKLAEMAK